MRLAFAAAALLASLPLHAEETDVTRFDGFMRTWKEIAAKRAKDDRKSFDVAVVDPSGFEYTATIDTTVGRTTEDGEKVVVQSTRFQDIEALKKREIEIPGLLVSNRWTEPLPLSFPAGAKVAVEEGVELKVGEVVLKCTKLALEQTGDDGAVLRIEIWVTAQDNLGVVKIVSESGPSSSVALTLKKWSVAAK